VQLTVPKGSAAGRKLRLKGRGLPGKNPGDFYALLAIVVPKAETDAARTAYESLAKAFPNFQPRPNS
jgi:curved DNA-binding protein